MKIIGIENNIFESVDSQDFSIFCIPDSSIIRNNDNFYIPNFSNQITAQLGMYFSLSKIGKHLNPEFIARYYKAYGVAINFVALNTLHDCFAKSVAPDIAYGFDNSFAISNMQIQADDIYVRNAEFAFLYNSQHIYFSATYIIEAMHRAIAQASEYYTIKIGDLFFVPFAKLPNFVAINDTFEAYINNQHLLSCTVK